MRRMSAWLVLATVIGVGVGSLITGNAAGAIVKAQAVIEQNNPAFHPFQTTVSPKSGFCQTIDVPAGDRLVIEYVSAYVEDSTADFMTFSTVAGGSTVNHYVTLVQSQDLSSISLGSQAVHFYADPSTQVSVCDSGLGIVSVSGYLVPLG
jgi:hypothetical protein